MWTTSLSASFRISGYLLSCRFPSRLFPPPCVSSLPSGLHSSPRLSSLILSVSLSLSCSPRFLFFFPFFLIFFIFLPWATSPPHFAGHQFIFTPSSYHPSHVGTRVSGPVQPFAGSPRARRPLSSASISAASMNDSGRGGRGRDRGERRMAGLAGGWRWRGGGRNEVSDKLSKGGWRGENIQEALRAEGGRWGKEGGPALRDHSSIASGATLGIDGADSRSLNRLHN